MNALAFSDTKFSFSKLTDHNKKGSKRHGSALQKLQKTREKWKKDRMRQLDFINKNLRENDEAREHTSTMLMKQCVNTTEYLQNK